MKDQQRIELASGLVLELAARTGVVGEASPRRYLWTDAFAVMTLIGLQRATSDARYGQMALALVDQVHRVLGKHRADDVRSGWLSGLSGAEAEAHPTAGGLRIGKPLGERKPGARFDQELEWERDGQYFHYLTKWMHALDRAAAWTGSRELSQWSVELARRAHAAFVSGPRRQRHMVWKLSIDLSYPLVASMGQHDPVDGYVTCRALERTATALGGDCYGIADAAADFATMIDSKRMVSSDPLGIGGLLVDGCMLVQLDIDHHLAAQLLASAAVGLRQYLRTSELHADAGRRLAFRELGLAIGLAAVERLAERGAVDPATRAGLSEVVEVVPLRGRIERFWARVESRQNRTWLEHREINEVMLATSLWPDGFLSLGCGDRADLPASAGAHP